MMFVNTIPNVPNVVNQSIVCIYEKLLWQNFRTKENFSNQMELIIQFKNARCKS